MSGEKDSCALDKVYPIIRAYIYCATEFQNDTNMTDVNHIYFDLVSRAVSLSYAVVGLC